MHMLSFPLLPCSQYAKEWKGFKMMQGVVESFVYVTAVEYGKYGHKLGQGLVPPAGQLMYLGLCMLVLGAQG